MGERGNEATHLCCRPCRDSEFSVGGVCTGGGVRPGDCTVLHRPLASAEARARMVRDDLAADGFIDGKSFAVSISVANNNSEELPKLAKGLIRPSVKVILAIGPGAVKAAQAAATTIPIVAVDLETDPVRKIAARREGRRSAAGAAEPVSPDRESQGGKATWASAAVIACRAGRRGDRIGLISAQRRALPHALPEPWGLPCGLRAAAAQRRCDAASHAHAGGRRPVRRRSR